MSNIEIKILTKSNWETYRSLRLAALNDSPDSFGSTYAREAAFSQAQWKSRINHINGSTNILPLVAEFDDRPAGLAWGMVHTPESKTAHVYQMWVSPDCRGAGIGRALLNQIISWAQGLPLSSLSLAVTTINLPAVSLYESLGFYPIGKPAPLKEGSLLLMQPMERKLIAKDK